MSHSAGAFTIPGVGEVALTARNALLGGVALLAAFSVVRAVRFAFADCDLSLYGRRRPKACMMSHENSNWEHGVCGPRGRCAWRSVSGAFGV